MDNLNDLLESAEAGYTRIAVYNATEDGFAIFTVEDVILEDLDSFTITTHDSIYVPVDDVPDDFEIGNVFTLTSPESGHIIGEYGINPESSFQVGLKYNPQIQSKYRELIKKRSEQFEDEYADEDDLTF